MAASASTLGGVEIRRNWVGLGDWGEDGALRLTLPRLRCGDLVYGVTARSSGTHSKQVTEDMGSGVSCDDREDAAEKSSTLAGSGVHEPKEGVPAGACRLGDVLRARPPEVPSLGPQRCPFPWRPQVAALWPVPPQSLQAYFVFNCLNFSKHFKSGRCPNI